MNKKSDDFAGKLYFINNFNFFSGLGDIQKFQGNDTTMDHFKLVLRDGNFLLVGAR